jgi:trans-2,3-dihydro-3-hydroxyanthranilate isomerase
MTAIPFSIVNVFTDRPWTGNHLAVVRGGSRLDDERKQAVAREIGPAAFVMTDDPGAERFDLRIFTPAREIMYAGHPVIGAVHVIAGEMLAEPVDRLEVSLPSGPMSIRLVGNGSSPTIYMRQQEPRFGVTYEPESVLACLSGVTSDDLEPDRPIREVSTGLPYVVVGVRRLDVLSRITIEPDRFASLVADSDAKTMLLYSAETRDSDHDLHMRVFAHHYGIPEDPATGSAAGALGAHLLDTGGDGSERLELRIEQGHEVARPGSLALTAAATGSGVEIDVGGTVVTVARGELV